MTVLSTTDASDTTTLALPGGWPLAIAYDVLAPPVRIVGLDGLPLRVSPLAP